MNELQFKKKMQHLLEINTALYKENQVLKKALEYQENQNKTLKNNAEIMERNIKRLLEKIQDIENIILKPSNRNYDE